MNKNFMLVCYMFDTVCKIEHNNEYWFFDKKEEIKDFIEEQKNDGMEVRIERIYELKNITNEVEV